MVVEDDSVLEWEEFEKRLHRFKFKSTAAFFNNFDTSSVIIQNVNNREKVRRYKSKEDRIINRLDLWVNACCPTKARNDAVNTKHGKFSTMNLGRLRRPFLRRTVSMENATDFPTAAAWTDILNKRRSRLSTPGFFRSRSNISTSSSPLERSFQDDDFNNVINFTDDIFNKTSDAINDLIRANKSRKIFEKKEAEQGEHNKVSDKNKNYSTPNGKQKKDSKSQENRTRQIRLFPSDCPVDPIITSPESIKQFDDRVLLDASMNNKFSPYPIFFTSNSEESNSNDKRFTKKSDDPGKTGNGKKHHTCTDRGIKQRPISGIMEEGRNMHNRKPNHNIRIHDTYYENKMRYYKDNPLQQTIRKSNDISTMQDYINSIKESRDSIKQCTKDIKQFLGSSSSNLQTSPRNPSGSPRNSSGSPRNSSGSPRNQSTSPRKPSGSPRRNVGSSSTPDSTPNTKRSKGTMVSSTSTPDISKLLSKSEQKSKSLMYKKENYRKSWSDIKSVLKQESSSEYLV